jgi:hypothetical protein
VQTIIRKTVSNPTEQPKNMMTGVTQGYTKNLESRGIGFQGRIVPSREGCSPEKGAQSAEEMGKTTNAREKRKEIDVFSGWLPGFSPEAAARLRVDLEEIDSDARRDENNPVISIPET